MGKRLFLRDVTIWNRSGTGITYFPVKLMKKLLNMDYGGKLSLYFDPDTQELIYKRKDARRRFQNKLQARLTEDENGKTLLVPR